MVRLDNGTRWAIVHAYQAHKTVHDISKSLDISKKTCYKWIRRHARTGSVDDMPRSGRKRVVSEAAAQKAAELLAGKQSKPPSQVIQHLCSDGMLSKPIHRTTLIRAAKRQSAAAGAPLHCVVGMPERELSPSTKAKRMAFAHEMKRKQFEWRRIMFTDRKKFLFKHPGSAARRYNWVLGTQKPEAVTVTHPQAYNVYGGITVFGVTKLYAVAGTSKHHSCYKNKKGQPAKNITAGEYKDVLLNHLLPAGAHIYHAQGLTMWQFQQDNDPTHRNAGKHINTYNAQHGSRISPLQGWPPNSPDLNLIENVWGYVDSRVQQKVCNSFEEFKKAVDDAFQAVPQSMLQSLFNSMGKRCGMCIQRGGDRTPY